MPAHIAHIKCKINKVKNMFFQDIPMGRASCTSIRRDYEPNTLTY